MSVPARGIVVGPAEQQHLLEFERFYERLDDHRDPYYLFFTSGLLHWVDLCLGFVPEDVNLVLIGAALEPEERRWVEGSVDRPFHHVRLPADDKTIWELLFAVNRSSFGWLDIDCLVLNPELFREVARPRPGVLASSVWTFPSRAGVDVLRTYLLFLHADAVREAVERFGVSPCTYAYGKGRKGRTAPYGFHRPLTPELVERIATVLPPEDAGRPPFLTERDYYDTLQVYQLVAQSLGYRLEKVRPLTFRGSDEIVHVGKVSYYNWGWETRNLPRNREVFATIARADLLALGRAAERLTPAYRERLATMREALPEIGVEVEPDALRSATGAALVEAGLSPEGAAGLVDRLAPS